ncbi:predicted protein [Streptomyces sp. AA4]|nr:predicted protein [Streptomyces sp. AA4]
MEPRSERDARGGIGPQHGFLSEAVREAHSPAPLAVDWRSRVAARRSGRTGSISGSCSSVPRPSW